MPKIAKVKRSNVAGSTPTLSYGELGWNSADGKLYAGNAANQAVLVNTPSESVVIGGGGSANIVEVATVSAFPATGAAGTLYIATDASRVFRWDASGVYVELGTAGGGGGGTGELPVASSSTLGGVKVGSGLTITDGVLSADNTLATLFVPPAPTSLTATAGNAQVSLAWTAPSVLSQTPITDYVVQYSTNGSTWTTFSDGTSTATSATVTGLTNGTAYQFRVAGVNAAGTGNYSTATSAVTPASVSIAYANKFAADAAKTSTHSFSGGSGTVTASLTGGGALTDTRLWLLVATTGTLSYTVTSSSETSLDGGRLYLTSSSPSSHSYGGAFNVASISGLTNVSAAVSGTADSTGMAVSSGTVAVTAGQYLVLRYTKDPTLSQGTDSITATLSIA